MFKSDIFSTARSALVLPLFLFACEDQPPRRDAGITDGTNTPVDTLPTGDGTKPTDGAIPPANPCVPKYITEQCSTVVEGNSWAFDPPEDTYDAEAVLDLRHLNEETAGQSGFIKLSADGRDFVKGDGAPIRFWAAHSTVYEKGEEALADHARFLAKRGVNMVRWHGHIPSEDEGAALNDINTEARSQLWDYVAAMKQEGIYLTISPYYALRKVQAHAAEDMHALLFVDPQLKAAYKQWLTQLLTPPNPKTGIALKDEPAIAIIQIQNEDSLLFWTVGNLDGPYLEMLEEQYGSWLANKYGSLQAALTAWGGAELDNDDPSGDSMAFYHIWEMTQDQTSGGAKAKRLADQTEFWTSSMRELNQEIVDFLRDDLGAQQLVNAGNWKTADPIRLNDAERYSYTSTEVIGVNRYYGGGVHEGEHDGWAIVAGDRFSGRSLLTDPRSLPVFLKQVAGHPMIIPESNWVPPLGYQSEGPFLISAYMSISGVDAFYWFNIGQPQFRPPSSANGYLPSLGKWVANTPEILGNFPAAALVFRKGYLRRAEAVVKENRSLDELWQRNAPIIAESPTFDPNRDKDYISGHSNIPGGVNPLAFLVGPVEVTYDADSSKSEVADLSKHIFEEDKVVCAATGELTWDYDNGVAVMDAPQAKGVSGFLHTRGVFELEGVTIESCNRYATIYIVSMDEAPIASSRQILIQTGTIARPTNWQEKATTWTNDQGASFSGFEVVSYGEPPWQIQNNDVTITIKNSVVTTATILDLNGVAREEEPLLTDGTEVSYTLPSDAKYVVLR